MEPGQLPVLSNIYITDVTALSQTYNFGTTVNSTDVITVQRPNVFYDNMGYSVYSLPNVQGELLYELTNTNAGPPLTQYITNYCGLNANLAVESLNYYSPPRSLMPVAVMKFIPSLEFSVKVFLVCGSLVAAVIGQTSEAIIFPIPRDFSGICYFYSSFLDYNTNQFFNSANLAFFVGKVESPFPGE